MRPTALKNKLNFLSAPFCRKEKNHEGTEKKKLFQSPKSRALKSKIVSIFNKAK